MKQKKVLLLGSYGQSNLGDDLLMWNYLQLLRERGFSHIYVNANTTKYIPKAVKKNFPELVVLNTYQTSIFRHIKLIKEVDCVVYGGGTLYKELYGSTGRSPYSVIFRLMAFNILAKLLGTRLYHLGIGIGSLKTGLGRLITKRALQAATLTVFRDQQSYDYAKQTLRVNPDKIQKSVDGLFLNHVWEKPWHKQALPVSKAKDRPVIGINVLSDIPDWVDRKAYIATMRQVINHLLDEGNQLVFVPFQHAFNPRSDLAFMRDAFKDELSRDFVTLLEEVPIDLVTSYLQQCDVFIGMRFHSLLLSTVARVPFVAVAYDTKCWRFIEGYQYPYAVKLEDLEAETVVNLCKQALKQRQKIKRQLADVAERAFKESEEDIRTLNL